MEQTEFQPEREIALGGRELKSIAMDIKKEHKDEKKNVTSVP